jgi:hypothetical protein
MRTSSPMLLALVTFGVSAVALAETPKPAPQLQEIKRLVGKWSGKGTMFAEGKTHAVTMTWDCVESSGAAGVRCRGQINGLPGFTYLFDDLWGYSEADKLAHWYTVTNAGEVHDHRGHLGADGGLLQFDGALDGKVFSEVITFKRKANVLTMSWNTTLGGAPRERGEVELTKK